MGERKTKKNSCRINLTLLLRPATREVRLGYGWKWLTWTPKGRRWKSSSTRRTGKDSYKKKETSQRGVCKQTETMSQSIHKVQNMGTRNLKRQQMISEGSPSGSCRGDCARGGWPTWEHLGPSIHLPQDEIDARDKSLQEPFRRRSAVQTPRMLNTRFWRAAKTVRWNTPLVEREVLPPQEPDVVHGRPSSR